MHQDYNYSAAASVLLLGLQEKPPHFKFEVNQLKTGKSCSLKTYCTNYANEVIFVLFRHRISGNINVPSLKLYQPVALAHGYWLTALQNDCLKFT